jgi:hypothetical protein
MSCGGPRAITVRVGMLRSSQTVSGETVLYNFGISTIEFYSLTEKGSTRQRSNLRVSCCFGEYYVVESCISKFLNL